MLQRVKKSNGRSEIELRMSTILKFIYYGTLYNVNKIQTGDILRDYQLSKSTKILHISNGYLKSTSSTPGLSNLCKL